jgi:hypothetical protein
LNELGSNEFSLMPKRKSPSTDAMSVQPIEHSSTAPNQLAYGANGRRATQDATSERTTSKGGCSPHRERKK